MSINHFSSDLPEALWWAQSHHQTMELPSSSKPNTTPAAATNFWANSQLYHHTIAANKPMSSTQNSAFNFDLNNEDDEEITIDDERQLNHSFSSTKAAAEAEQEIREIPKEPLFEKPLTPSDVGKLNRLVIPKQHAEKYFPLSGNNGNGNDSGEKGLLLNFEDESGKPWRFRYSYWNSSQSYVLTKGWSRFVKEKKLDAGDIVLFERHRLDGDRLFIGWRRRSAAAAAGGNPAGQESPPGVSQAAAVRGGGGGGGGWTRMYFPPGHPYPAQQQQQQQAHDHGPAFPYQADYLHAAASASASSVLQNQTTATSANSKRLRLFGVNLECQPQPDEYSESSEPVNPPEGSSTWSQLNQGQGQGQGQGHAQAHHQFQYYPKVHHAYFDHHNHMDINFSRDVNETRYRQG